MARRSGDRLGMGELKMEIIGTKLHTHERPDQYRRKRMTDYVDLTDVVGDD